MYYYKEQQKFTSIALGIIILLHVIFIYALITQLILSIPFGNKPAPNGLLIFIYIFILFITWMYFKVKLIIAIDARYLNYRWSIFQKHFNQIELNNILKLEPITTDFIGYGFKISDKYGTINFANGNKGILIIMKNKEKFLFSTKNALKIIESITMLKAKTNEFDK